MNPSPEIPRADSSQRPVGLIVFCEKNLRYEGGTKAWLFLGPYLLGAVLFEKFISPALATGTSSLGAYMGFLAYLVFFPAFWRRILRLLSPDKTKVVLPAES